MTSLPVTYRDVNRADLCAQVVAVQKCDKMSHGGGVPASRIKGALRAVKPPLCGLEMPGRGRPVRIESSRQVRQAREGCFPQGRRAAEAVGMAPRTPRTPRETNTGRQVGSLALRSA